MKLKHAFRATHALFKMAIDEDNTEIMARALTRKMEVLGFLDLYHAQTYAALTPKMAAFLARNVTPEVEKRWDRYGLRGRKVGNELLAGIYNAALSRHPQKEMAEAFMTPLLTPQQQVAGVLKHLPDAADRLDLFSRIVGRDHTVLKDPDRIAHALCMRERLPEFDVLVAAGYPLHKDNESLLRKAAENDKRAFARHLVTAHRADIDLAIHTARFAGQDSICDVLEDIRRETHPDAPPLQTFAQMAEELTALRRTVTTLEKTVTDLAARVKTLENPAAKIDKAPLRKRS